MYSSNSHTFGNERKRQETKSSKEKANKNFHQLLVPRLLSSSCSPLLLWVSSAAQGRCQHWPGPGQAHLKATRIHPPNTMLWGPKSGPPLSLLGPGTTNPFVSPYWPRRLCLLTLFMGEIGRQEGGNGQFVAACGRCLSVLALNFMFKRTRHMLDLHQTTTNCPWNRGRWPTTWMVRPVLPFHVYSLSGQARFDR